VVRFKCVFGDRASTFGVIFARISRPNKLPLEGIFSEVCGHYGAEVLRTEDLRERVMLPLLTLDGDLCQSARYPRRSLQDVKVPHGEVLEVRVVGYAFEDIRFGVAFYRLAVLPHVDAAVGALVSSFASQVLETRPGRLAKAGATASTC
jgi:hypothetical protein